VAVVIRQTRQKLCAYATSVRPLFFPEGTKGHFKTSKVYVTAAGAAASNKRRVEFYDLLLEIENLFHQHPPNRLWKHLFVTRRFRTCVSRFVRSLHRRAHGSKVRCMLIWGSLHQEENMTKKAIDGEQRSILNLSPRGEVVPWGVMLSPGGEILCSPLHSS
jgi:hypothetical protein